MKIVDESVLYQLYVVDAKPMHEVAREMNLAVGTIYNKLKKFGIPTREAHQGMKGKKTSDETKLKLSIALTGRKMSKETVEKMAEAHRLKGAGHTKKRHDGYVQVYYPKHHRSNKSGYVMEHILIMEEHIGRHLNPDEVVHHINFVRNDNRIENLKIMTKTEHMSFHSSERWKAKRKEE